VARLDTWLTTYCHVEDSPYVQAVGAKTLIAGVARILCPGCKVDTMTILVGEQGYMKSWVWRVLASEPWFTDHLSDIHSKDAALDLRSKWIVEFADLDNFGRSETETIKRFLSATQDHYRAPYERHASTVPRAVIFAGTTNKETFFKDETGNRRFWPVKVEQTCELASLARDRDQLWAEALHRFHAGEIWYLTGEACSHFSGQASSSARCEVAICFNRFHRPAL
jgi:putative DNA primase/helicase